MDKIYIDLIAKGIGVAHWQVENCIQLIEEGATIPFISRYRKERTGGLDETQVAEVRHHYLKFDELNKRKKSILESIQSQEKLTSVLEKQINDCVEIQTLEDIYLPDRKSVV